MRSFQTVLSDLMKLQDHCCRPWSLAASSVIHRQLKQTNLPLQVYRLCHCKSAEPAEKKRARALKPTRQLQTRAWTPLPNTEFPLMLGIPMAGWSVALLETFIKKDDFEAFKIHLQIFHAFSIFFKVKYI